jgi:hypothetical protein
MRIVTVDDYSIVDAFVVHLEVEIIVFGARIGSQRNVVFGFLVVIVGSDELAFDIPAVSVANGVVDVHGFRLFQEVQVEAEDAVAGRSGQRVGVEACFVEVEFKCTYGIPNIGRSFACCIAHIFSLDGRDVVVADLNIHPNGAVAAVNVFQKEDVKPSIERDFVRISFIIIRQLLRAKADRKLSDLVFRPNLKV